jgi:YD repeat-containing protein
VLSGGGYAGASHAYDARDRLIGTTVLGSVATAYGTDQRGRTTSIVATRAGAAIFSAAHTYAPNSLISVADWSQPLLPASPQRMQYRCRYVGVASKDWVTWRVWIG